MAAPPNHDHAALVTFVSWAGLLLVAGFVFFLLIAFGAAVWPSASPSLNQTEGGLSGTRPPLLAPALTQTPFIITTTPRPTTTPYSAIWTKTPDPLAAIPPCQTATSGQVCRPALPPQPTPTPYLDCLLVTPEDHVEVCQWIQPTLTPTATLESIG